LTTASLPQARSPRAAASPFDQPAPPQFQHGDRTGPATTTCGRSISIHHSAQPTASLFGHRAAPKLQHKADTGMVRTTCSRSTSTRTTAWPTASHFDEPAGPELQQSGSTRPTSTTCSKSTSRHRGGGRQPTPSMCQYREVQRSNSTRPVNTTCSKSISTSTGTRPAAIHYGRPAASRLDYSGCTGPARSICCTSTSARVASGSTRGQPHARHAHQPQTYAIKDPVTEGPPTRTPTPKPDGHTTVKTTTIRSPAAEPSPSLAACRHVS
jgi:hypothetical protein